MKALLCTCKSPPEINHIMARNKVRLSIPGMEEKPSPNPPDSLLVAWTHALRHTASAVKVFSLGGTRDAVGVVFLGQARAGHTVRGGRLGGGDDWRGCGGHLGWGRGEQDLISMTLVLMMTGAINIS